MSDPKGAMVEALAAIGRAGLFLLGVLVWVAVNLGIPLGLIFGAVYLAIKVAE